MAALEKEYPEIFMEDFDDFIDEIRTTAIHLDQKYDECFIDLIDTKCEEINLH